MNVNKIFAVLPPSVMNGLTKAVNPLQLLKHYAVGIPVISTL